MKIKDLEAYRAVMATGSTQGAANLLGISQSAASRRIAQLEETIDLQLFIREGARLIPSRINELLEPHISDVLERVHILTSTADEIRAGRYASPPLRIAVPPGISRRLIPAIVAKFMDLNPDTRFEVLHGTYDVISRMLEDKQVEIGFLRHPVKDPNFAAAPTIFAGSVCVLPVGHPLCALEVIQPRDLRDLPLVLLGSGKTPRHDIDLVFSSHGVKPKTRLVAHSVSSACGFAASGIGISIVNSLLVRDCMDLDIVLRPFSPDVPHQFGFVYHARPPLPMIAHDFIEFATNELNSILATDVM